MNLVSGRPPGSSNPRTDLAHVLQCVVDFGGVDVGASLHAFDDATLIDGRLGCSLCLFQYMCSLVQRFLRKVDLVRFCPGLSGTRADGPSLPWRIWRSAIDSQESRLG